MEIKFPFEFYHKSGLGPFNFPGTHEPRGYYCFNHENKGGAIYTLKDIEGKIASGDWIVTEQPEEKPKYIHDAIIRAWLDGEQIQCKDSDGTWYDFQPAGPGTLIPGFWADQEYRIKPKIEQVSFTLAELFYDDTLKDKLSNTHLKLTANIEDGKVISISVQ